MAINTFYVCKYAQMPFNLEHWIIRPGAAAALMGIVVWLMQHYLPSHRLLTIMEIIVGVCVYTGAAFALKVLSVSDVKALLRKRGKSK